MSRAVAAETTTAQPDDEAVVYDESTTQSDGTIVYDESYTVAELKTIAKEKGITGYSSMTKAELLEVLNNGN